MKYIEQKLFHSARSSNLTSVIFSLCSGCTELKSMKFESILPAQDKFFLGRDQQIKDVADLLKRDRRIVTIAGTYGLGKSAVALGVCFHCCRTSDLTTSVRVDLRGCSTVDAIILRLIHSFNLRLKV